MKSESKWKSRNGNGNSSERNESGSHNNLTANATAFYGNVTETSKDSGQKRSDEAVAAFSYSSGFAEIAIDQLAGLTIGMDYSPDSISMETTTREIRSSLYASGGTPTGETTDGSIQDIRADVTDVTTVYLAIPLMSTGLNFKAGYMTGTLETKETLATGSTYKDVDLDGFTFSLFYDGDIGEHMFYRLEGGYIQFDDISATGSQEGGTGGSYNKITAELGGVLCRRTPGARRHSKVMRPPPLLRGGAGEHNEDYDRRDRPYAVRAGLW
jgi:hypothetical protein